MTTKTPEVDLPDVNLWLALALEDHPLHARARLYWVEESLTWLAFSRVTALGLLRLLTNSIVMGGQPMNVAEAWQSYQAFRSSPEIVFAPDPPDLEIWLERLVLSGTVTPRLWTDAHLASLAVAANYRLVSFDRDFQRFDALDFLLLKPGK